MVFKKCVFFIDSRGNEVNEMIEVNEINKIIKGLGDGLTDRPINRLTK